MARCVLVTGGAKRLGRAIALQMARSGRDVAIHCHSSTDEAEALQDEIAELGQRAAIYRADLADLEAGQAMIREVAGDFPQLEGLVNSASVFERDTFGAMTADFYHRQMRINTEAPIFLTQAFYQAIQTPGWVLNMIDSKIFQITPAFFSYTLSKLALEDATLMLARACAPKLRVNAIAPGLVLRSGNQTQAEFERIHDLTPVGKGPTCDEIAAMALTLADAPSTTGQIIALDGGSHFHTPKPGGGF